MAKAKSRPIVEITWVDSAFCRGWQSLDDKKRDQGTVICRSAGLLLDADAKQVRIVISEGENGSSVAEGLSIPRSAIIRLRTLKS